MEERGIIVRCDENICSDTLIKRLKNYDRRLARHTFDHYEYMSDLISTDKCVVDEIVCDGNTSVRHYVRCIIMEGSVTFCCTDTGFYDCCFIGVENIYHAELFGESISVGKETIAKRVHVPESSIVFEEISIEQYNKIIANKEKYEILTGALAAQYTDTLHAISYGRPYNPTTDDSVIIARNMNIARISERIGTDVRCIYSDMIIFAHID